jgi:hypothetical protein
MAIITELPVTWEVNTLPSIRKLKASTKPLAMVSITAAVIVLDESSEPWRVMATSSSRPEGGGGRTSDTDCRFVGRGAGGFDAGWLELQCSRLGAAQDRPRPKSGPAAKLRSD